jgi:hypothetical protein
MRTTLTTLNTLALALALAATVTGCKEETQKGNGLIEDCEEALQERGVAPCYYCKDVVKEPASTTTAIFSPFFGIGNHTQWGGEEVVTIEKIPGTEDCEDCFIDRILDEAALDEERAEEIYYDCRCDELTDLCEYDAADPGEYNSCMVDAAISGLCSFCDVIFTMNVRAGMAVEEAQEAYEECLDDPEVRTFSIEFDPSTFDTAEDNPFELAKLSPWAPQRYRAPLSQLQSLVTDSGQGTLWQLVDAKGNDYAVRVGFLPKGSTVHQLGFKSGDVIRRVNGEPIVSLSDLAPFVLGAESGDTYTVAIRRQDSIVRQVYIVEQ